MQNKQTGLEFVNTPTCKINYSEIRLKLNENSSQNDGRIKLSDFKAKYAVVLPLIHITRVFVDCRSQLKNAFQMQIVGKM